MACRLNQLILYLQRSNWNIIDFPCLVGKMANTTLRFKATNKAFICCSVRLSTSGKRSSSTKVKISLNIHSSKSSESSHWSSSILQTIFCPGREKQNLPKEMRWEISSASPRYGTLNKSIKFICMFVKISTNQHPRVRSWPCCLLESEIRGFTTRSLFCRENF